MLKNVFGRVKISPVGKIVLGFMLGLLIFTLWQLLFVPYASGNLWLPMSPMSGNPEPETQIRALQQEGVLLGRATQPAASALVRKSIGAYRRHRRITH